MRDRERQKELHTFLRLLFLNMAPVVPLNLPLQAHYLQHGISLAILLTTLHTQCGINLLTHQVLWITATALTSQFYMQNKYDFVTELLKSLFRHPQYVSECNSLKKHLLKLASPLPLPEGSALKI